MLNRFILAGIFLCPVFGFTIEAQVDTSYDLPAAIIDVRYERSSHSLDTLPDHQVNTSLGNLLSEQPFGFVRSNSGMALASFSIRGGSPEQSTVFWNGISLQNNTNGVVDLNLLPTAFFDGVEFNALQSTTRGSGSTAGSMNLTNRDITGDSVQEINLTLGSFESYNASAKLVYRTHSIRHQTRISSSFSKNNYSYRGVRYNLDNSIDTLEHARSEQVGILHQSKIIFKRIRPMNLRFWLQKNNRQIPATMLESRSNKSQTDETLRIQGDWSLPVLNGDLTINTAWFNEKLIYRDFDTFNYVSNNSTLLLHYVNALSAKHSMGVDVEGRIFMADADTFYNKMRTEASTAFHYQYLDGRLTINSGLRMAAYTTFQTSPLLYQLRAHYRLKHWNINAKINSNYRVPTFNNLFWRPGGNSTLIPERSHQQEMSIGYVKTRFKFSVSIYSTLITNQIQWLPAKKGYFEAQQDLDSRRWNRGVEVEVQSTVKKLSQTFKASYSRSGDWDKGSSPSIYQQLFVPTTQLFHEVKYSNKRWMFGVTNQYTSERFINVDNSEFLEPFWLLGVHSRVRLSLISVSFSVRNVLNQSYQILSYRPMRGRYLELGLNFRIK
jgi:outer membrane cobalamin receptor